MAETYDDTCRVGDEDRREECPDYLMGLCSKWPGEPCPVEAEDEYKKYYRLPRDESDREDAGHRPGKMTDQEAIDILNNYKIDCGKPGAFKVIAAISVAVSCLEERRDSGTYEADQGTEDGADRRQAGLHDGGSAGSAEKAGRRRSYLTLSKTEGV